MGVTKTSTKDGGVAEKSGTAKRASKGSNANRGGGGHRRKEATAATKDAERERKVDRMKRDTFSALQRRQDGSWEVELVPHGAREGAGTTSMPLLLEQGRSASTLLGSDSVGSLSTSSTRTKNTPEVEARTRLAALDALVLARSRAATATPFMLSSLSSSTAIMDPAVIRHLYMNTPSEPVMPIPQACFDLLVQSALEHLQALRDGTVHRHMLLSSLATRKAHPALIACIAWFGSLFVAWHPDLDGVQQGTRGTLQSLALNRTRELAGLVLSSSPYDEAASHRRLELVGAPLMNCLAMAVLGIMKATGNPFKARSCLDALARTATKLGVDRPGFRGAETTQGWLATQEAARIYWGYLRGTDMVLSGLFGQEPMADPEPGYSFPVDGPLWTNVTESTPYSELPQSKLTAADVIGWIGMKSRGARQAWVRSLGAAAASPVSAASATEMWGSVVIAVYARMVRLQLKMKARNISIAQVALLDGSAKDVDFHYGVDAEIRNFAAERLHLLEVLDDAFALNPPEILQWDKTADTPSLFAYSVSENRAPHAMWTNLLVQHAIRVSLSSPPFPEEPPAEWFSSPAFLYASRHAISVSRLVRSARGTRRWSSRIPVFMRPGRTRWPCVGSLLSISISVGPHLGEWSKTPKRASKFSTALAKRAGLMQVGPPVKFGGWRMILLRILMERRKR